MEKIIASLIERVFKNWITTVIGVLLGIVGVIVGVIQVIPTTLVWQCECQWKMENFSNLTFAIGEIREQHLRGGFPRVANSALVMLGLHKGLKALLRLR